MTVTKRNELGQQVMAYPDPEVFKVKINEYFKLCKADKIKIDYAGGSVSRQRPYTISGLCLHLSINRNTWSKYSNMTGYEEICALAKLQCEDDLVVGMLTGKYAPVPSIFIAKNCYGYRDSFDINTNVSPEQLSAADIRAQLDRRRQAEIPEHAGQLEAGAIKAQILKVKK